MEHSRRNVILLFTSQVIALASTITILTYSALVGKMLTGSITLATIPGASAVVGAALTAYPASMLMKRFGRKRGFQLGAIFALISGILTFYGIFIGNFYLFTVGVFCHGVFQSFSAFYRFAAMEVSAPDRQKQAVSYVLAGGLLAAMIAPSAALFFETHFPLPIQYAGTYILVILLSFLTQVVLLFLTFPDHMQTVEERAAEEGTSKPPLREVLRRPAFICASLNAAGAYLLMSYVMTSSPMEIVEYCGFPVSDAASVIQWHTASMFLPAFFTGTLIARFGSVKILLLGMLFFLVSATFAIAGQELFNFYGALVLLGFGWNFMFTSGTTLLERAYTTADKSHVQGINDFVVFGLTAMATLTSGFMLENFGWENLNKLVFIIIGLLLALTLWYVLSERKTDTLKSVENI